MSARDVLFVGIFRPANIRYIRPVRVNFLRDSSTRFIGIFFYSVHSDVEFPRLYFRSRNSRIFLQVHEYY